MFRACFSAARDFARAPNDAVPIAKMTRKGTILNCDAEVDGGTEGRGGREVEKGRRIDRSIIMGCVAQDREGLRLLKLCLVEYHYTNNTGVAGAVTKRCSPCG